MSRPRPSSGFSTIWDVSNFGRRMRRKRRVHHEATLRWRSFILSRTRWNRRRRALLRRLRRFFARLPARSSRASNDWMWSADANMLLIWPQLSVLSEQMSPKVPSSEYHVRKVRAPGSNEHVVPIWVLNRGSCCTTNWTTAKYSPWRVRTIRMSSRFVLASWRPLNSRGTGPLMRRCITFPISLR